MAAAPDTSRIWLTYKARINAERRLKGYGILAHLAITWYSFLLIVLGILQSRIDAASGADAGPLAIILSVLVFGLSLLFYGFRFEERAGQFRECYLKLQRLWQDEGAALEKLEAYSGILDHYPNHEQRDFDKVIFEGWQRGNQIYNSTGPIQVTRSLIVRGYTLAFAKWLIIVAAFGWPLIAAAILVA